MIEEGKNSRPYFAFIGKRERCKNTGTDCAPIKGTLDDMFELFL
jgi:hypothetical protein